MKRVVIWFVIVAGAWLGVKALGLAPRPSGVSDERSPISLLSKSADTRFTRAMGKHEFVFPRDHGPHRDFQSEWWYFTGNLVTDTGRRFGFQLTFFRFALNPISAVAPKRRSAWAANEVYEAHFALTDVGNQRFHSVSRSSRAALDMAGAQSEPFRVWVDDWSAAAETNAEVWPMRLTASSKEANISLVLEPLKGVVLQGEAGLSQKSAQSGNASYYYSYPRISAQGLVTVGSEQLHVEGLVWFDREWSTSALSEHQQGWDWLSVQFEDGSDFMFYRLRLLDGSTDRWSAGVWIDPQGGVETLGADAVEMIPTQWWASDQSGIRYPTSWKVSVKPKDMTFIIDPWVPGQEWRQRFRYWEGAVLASGRLGAKVLQGSGYLELVGY